MRPDNNAIFFFLFFFFFFKSQTNKNIIFSRFQKKKNHTQTKQISHKKCISLLLLFRTLLDGHDFDNGFYST